MSFLRSVGYFAGGAAEGAKSGMQMGMQKNMMDAYKELAGAQKEWYAQQMGNAAPGQPQLTGGPQGTPSFTQAAATDAASQPPGTFNGGAPNVQAALQPPPPTPYVTAMTKQARRVPPLPFAADSASFTPQE
jgi:hypothetical protein